MWYYADDIMYMVLVLTEEAKRKGQAIKSTYTKRQAANNGEQTSPLR